MNQHYSVELKNDNFLYSKATITLVIGVVLGIVTYNTTSKQELGLLKDKITI